MRQIVDPRLRLLLALTPGTLMTDREASSRIPMSETAFGEAIVELTDTVPGLESHAGGIQMTGGADLIDPGLFVEHLPERLADRIANAAFYALCESTNSQVLTLGTPDVNQLNVALAEFQTGGRGRQGRSWTSGFAEGVCLTLAMRMAAETPIAPTMTLAVGTRIAETLDPHLTRPVLLKWPNDLILDDGKLGGILVELTTLPDGDHLMRVGVGINHVVPELSRASDELPALPPAALPGHVRHPISRSKLAAELVAAITSALDTHRTHGFAAFRPNWQERDYLRHQRVEVFDSERVRHGTAVGIDDRGALKVDTDDGVLSLMSGDVRVRRR